MCRNIWREQRSRDPRELPHCREHLPNPPQDTEGSSGICHLSPGHGFSRTATTKILPSTGRPSNSTQKQPRGLQG